MKKKSVFTTMFMAAFLLTALLPISALAVETEEGAGEVPDPNAITITKPPYGEAIYAGMGCTFIARAENYTSIVWRFISPDGHSFDYDKLGNRFPSLGTAGGDTEVFVLNRVPLEMHNWKVACLFKNASTEALTDTALLEVFENTQTITITRQPVGAVVEPDDDRDVVLSAAAMCPEGGWFAWQWFSAAADSYVAMHAIRGATEDSYTVPREVGTRYYCATAAIITNAGTTDPVYTDIVEVTFRPEEHIHVYSDVYSYNDISHWHQCTCGGHADEAFHTYEWTVIKAPTDEEDGVQTGVCTVCGYETTQPIPAGSQSPAPVAAPQKDNTFWLLLGLSLVAGAVIAAAAVLIRRVLRSDDGEK